MSASRIAFGRGRVALAATAVIAAGAMASSALPRAGAAGSAQACQPRGNVGSIIDDSGSMRSTDRDKLRVDAMNLFMDHRSNQGKVLSATEFGTSAATVFGPTPINDQNRPGMKSALAGAIQANNGGTDYNDAFAHNQSLNPNHNARIFLTDGGHNEGAYQNGHRGGPPTHVIGLNVGSSNEPLLRQIASETGGQFFPANFAGDISPAVNEITALINCQQPPAKVQPDAPQPGKGVQATTALTSKDKAVNVAMTTQGTKTSEYTVALAEKGRKLRKGRAVVLCWGLYPSFLAGVEETTRTELKHTAKGLTFTTVPDYRKVLRSVKEAQEVCEKFMERFLERAAQRGRTTADASQTGETKTCRPRKFVLHVKNRSKKRSKRSRSRRSSVAATAAQKKKKKKSRLNTIKKSRLQLACSAGNAFMLADVRKRGKGALKSVLSGRMRLGAFKTPNTTPPRTGEKLTFQFTK